jgi:hypothetical protein
VPEPPVKTVKGTKKSTANEGFDPFADDTGGAE